MSVIENIVKSRSFKNFMAKLYGWGAAVVILGALFKILHLDGADIMLLLGMGVEAVIFFFSAFEPPHVDPDWSLVYPELAGMYNDDEGFDGELDDGLHVVVENNGSDMASQKLDQMLEDAKIGPELIESLGKGLENLSKNAGQFSDLSSSVAANEAFVGNLKEATSNVGDLSNAYGKTAVIIEKEAEAANNHLERFGAASKAANTLSETYTHVSETLQSELSATQKFNTEVTNAANSASKLAENYNKSADMVSAASASLDFSDVDTSNYGTQLKKVSDNMQQLSQMYELQLQNSKTQLDATEKLQTAMTTFFENMQETAQQTMQYKEQSELLTRNVAELNKVYGNMLSAMTVRQS